MGQSGQVWVPGSQSWRRPCDLDWVLITECQLPWPDLPGGQGDEPVGHGMWMDTAPTGIAPWASSCDHRIPKQTFSAMECSEETRHLSCIRVTLLSAGLRKSQFYLQFWPNCFAAVCNARCKLSSLQRLVALGLNEMKGQKNSAVKQS